jgi:hypothetical protein
MGTAAKDFRDTAACESLYVKRKGGATWGALEAEYGLAGANGMNAFRVFWRHVILTGKPDPLPVSLRKDAAFADLLEPLPPAKPDNAGLPEGEHKMFDTLVKVIGARVNALAVGPAGSGKTSAAERAAAKLGLDYYSISVGGQTTQSQVQGYMHAGGEYVPTVFRKAFQNGGLFLIDEMDAGNPNVLTCLNAALAVSPGGSVAFPDGMVKRHPDFVVVAAANTWGQGADRQYVGRNQLDAATLDRFMGKIFWDYDERLELRIAGNSDWTKRVQRIRKAVYSLKVRLMVTPRASIEGAKLLKAGLDAATVEDLTIFNASDAETKRKVLAAA